MSFNHFQIILIYSSFLFLQINSYIIVPLKSTDELYFSKLSKTDLTINNKEKIHEIFLKYLNNVLFTDLLIGEPEQKATSFISQGEHGFMFYEEYSTKELKEIGFQNYNSYSTSPTNNSSKNCITKNTLKSINKLMSERI